MKWISITIYYPINILGAPVGSASPKAPNANPQDLLSLGCLQEFSGYFQMETPEKTIQVHREDYIACLSQDDHFIEEESCRTPNGDYDVPLPKRTLSGSVTLKFGKKVVQGTGDDFFVHENPLQYNSGDWYKEYARVSVSPDNLRWYTYPCDPLNGDFTKCAGHKHTPSAFSTEVGFGGDGFELSETPYKFIQYIKIEDATPVTNIFTQTVEGKSTKGFDLDGVSGFWK